MGCMTFKPSNSRGGKTDSKRKKISVCDACVKLYT
jgi:hypothetical protein